MWFKQLQLFQLVNSMSYHPENLAEQLQQLEFKPCLPSLPLSSGWIAPIESEIASLVHGANGLMLFCLQIEEKILPSSVINQNLKEKIQNLEEERGQKVGRKEKQSLKDELTFTLLSKAFSKYTKVYMYIDTHKQQLLLNTVSAKYTDFVMAALKKCLPQVELQRPELKNTSLILTHWLQHKTYPASMGIEKTAVLQDPKDQKRTIRCQNQDLFASSIQQLIKDGCAVKQIALSWQDRINFTLTEDFHIRSIRYQDEILALAKDNYTETAEQQFDSDFIIMTQSINQMFADLLPEFLKNEGTARVMETKITTEEIAGA